MLLCAFRVIYIHDQRENTPEKKHIRKRGAHDDNIETD
nr:MAG TPA: hypothetical protein [Bacteriophage sp.]